MLDEQIAIKLDGTRIRFVTFRTVKRFVNVDMYFLQKVERKVSDRPMISTNVPSVKKDAVPKDGAGFWDVVNSAPHQGIPTNEWSRFVNAMKQVISRFVFSAYFSYFLLYFLC